jgi:hypothetical protein
MGCPIIPHGVFAPVGNQFGQRFERFKRLLKYHEVLLAKTIHFGSVV